MAHGRIAASKTPSRARTTKLAPIIEAISEHSYEFGLSEDELLPLVQLVSAKSELDQGNVTNLIKHLYPSGRVSNDVIVHIINGLGRTRRSPPTTVQVALVRWTTAIYDVLQDSAILSRFYGVLFNLLDMISLRPGICQLLSLVTKRKHVRPFRIQHLLELAQQNANEPALLILLRVYRNFCPEIIAASTATKTLQSLRPDIEWQQRLRIIQQNNAAIVGDGVNLGGFRIARNSKKGESKANIPEVHTFRASEGSLTLEEIQTAYDLAQHLEIIELPSQMVAVLRDPLLQKYLQLANSAETQQRLDFWVSRYFEEELESVREGFGPSTTLSELLASTMSYAESSQTLLPIVERFLRMYLPLWNGYSDLRYILGLLSFLPPQPFSELQRSILSNLQSSIFSSADSPFEALLGFYTSLLQRWMSPKTPANSGTTPRGFMKSNALFELIEHVSILAESALDAGRPEEAAIISFYENIADLITVQISQKKQILPPILPSKSLTYALVSSSSLSQLSRLCALLVMYKRCFENQEAGVTRVYQANATDLLNGYLMDICNMVWRSRALNASDPNARGLLCPDTVTSGLQSYLSKVERDYSVHTMFDFSHSALIASMSQEAFFLREDEAQRLTTDDGLLHAGPVTQRSLIVLEKEGGLALSWKEYRLEVLNWLQNHGLDGMKQLMFATMKDLMK